jgi:tetratricopeptide (TPR) repeat protein
LAHEEGRLADAEKAYLEILSKSPDSGSVLNALGTVFLDQAKPDQAKKLFEKAANLNPPNLSACYNLGRLKQMEGDDKGAITFTGPLLRSSPDLVWHGTIWGWLTGKSASRRKPSPVFGGLWHLLLTWRRHGTTWVWHRMSFI